jgi:LmbE family N-acetylglucosaminyl deacetylase
MNPYEPFVRDFARLLRQGKELPLGGVPPLAKSACAGDAPKALLFSPHPDDEVITGALPLRLLREARMKVINVAVTLGSNPARRWERWQELTACCAHIGFGLLAAAEKGLEGVNLKTRQQHPTEWAQSVAGIAALLSEERPQFIFFPHEADWNSSHIGTHQLVVDALTKLGDDFSCFTVETEFWGAMAAPNLLVESSERDVTDLLTALSFHAGEVRRNPYHLRMMAWLIDNVRRGAELVGGQGGAAPDFLFGTLYRLRRWRRGKFERVLESGKFLSQAEDPSAWLGG